MGGQKAVVSSDIIIYIFPENDKSNGSVNTNIPRQMTFKYRASNVHITIMQICSAPTVNVFTKFNFAICHTRLQMLRITANIEIVNRKSNNFFFLNCKRYSEHLTKFNFLSIIDKDISMSRPVTTKNISRGFTHDCIEKYQKSYFKSNHQIRIIESWEQHLTLTNLSHFSRLNSSRHIQYFLNFYPTLANCKALKVAAWISASATT